MNKKSVIDLLDEDEDAFEYDDLDQEIKEDLQMIESFKKEIIQNQKAQQGLQTIVEVVDESQSRLEYIQDDESQISIPVMLIEDESPQKQLYKFKEYAKQREQEKQRVEKQFKAILKQQKEHLMKEYKETEIMKKLEKQIKPSQLQQTVQELLRQNLILSAESFEQESPKQQQFEQIQDKNKKVQSSNKLVPPCKCEQYIKEIQDYKLKINEFEDTIKILKVQIKKMEQEKGSFNNSSTSTQASKTDKLQEQNEQLKQEIVQMKLQFTQERDSLKSELQRAKRVQSAVQQQKQVQLTEKQINELEKVKVEKTQLECQLRNLQKETQDHISQLQKEIKDLKKKEQTLPTPPQKMIKSAEEKYQLQIQKLEQQIQQIKQNYSLDNQINLLFPTTYNHVLYLMNIFNKLEQLDNSKDIKIYLFGKFLQVAKPYLMKFIQGLSYIKQSIIYSFTRQKIDHPSHQEIIQRAVKMIRASPTTLEEEIIKLKSINKQLSDERDEFKDKYNRLEKELEEKKQTYNRLDELVRVDKYDLVNRLMSKVLTQEIQDKVNGVCHTEFDQIKEYCKLIIQSAPIQVIYQKVEVEKEVELKKDTKTTKCSHEDRHQKRNQIPIKSQYYNK